MSRLITEKDVLAAKRANQSDMAITPKTIVTPSARDAARAHGIRLVIGTGKKESATATTSSVSQQITKGPIAIGCDHGGFEMKSVLVSFLRENGFAVNDLGCYSTDPVDYPDIAHLVAELVKNGEAKAGIIIDGAGIGSAVVANKVPGIRAACCNDLFTAVNSREHNGANILTLGGRVIGDELAKKIALVWLTTDFGGGRHKKRLDKVTEIDARYRR